MRSFLLSAFIAIILSATSFSQGREIQAVELNHKGIQEYEKKNYQIATGLFEQAIALKPDFAKAHYNMGSAYFHLKRLDLAARALENATKYDPRSAYFNQLGVVYLESGEFAKAVKALDEAVRSDPRNSRTLYNLGCANMRLGNFKGAVQKLEEAKLIDPANAEIRLNLAVSLREQKRLAAAVSEMEAAVLIRPDDSELRFFYANLLLLAKDRTGALAQYAVLKTSDHGRAQLLFDEIYKAQVVRASKR